MIQAILCYKDRVAALKHVVKDVTDSIHVWYESRL